MIYIKLAIFATKVQKRYERFLSIKYFIILYENFGSFCFCKNA